MVAGEAGVRSLGSDLKNAIEEVEGRRACEITMGLRRIIASGSCRMERICALLMAAGMEAEANVSVELLRTGGVSCGSMSAGFEVLT